MLADLSRRSKAKAEAKRGRARLGPGGGRWGARRGSILGDDGSTQTATCGTMTDARQKQRIMDIPKVNILESYEGLDAINWVKVHTITASTFLDNEELFHETIQFHQDLSVGRASFRVPDRLDWVLPMARPSLISFELNNVVEVTVIEFPESKGFEIEVTVEFNNGATLCIILNRKRKIAGIRVSLGKMRE